MVAISGPGWRLAPSLQAYVDEADEAFPGRDHSSDGSIGDQAHASRTSDHNPYEGWVHAVDLDEDLAPGLDLKAFADRLRAEILADLTTGRRPRIRYLIYEGRICKSYASNGYKAGQWQPYTGPNAHLHHLHLSIDRTPEARTDLRRWGFKATPKPPVTAPTEENTMYFVSAKANSNVWFFEPGRRTLVSTSDRAAIAKAAGIPDAVAEVSDKFFAALAEGRSTHQ